MTLKRLGSWCRLRQWTPNEPGVLWTRWCIQIAAPPSRTEILANQPALLKSALTFIILEKMHSWLTHTRSYTTKEQEQMFTFSLWTRQTTLSWLITWLLHNKTLSLPRLLLLRGEARGESEGAAMLGVSAGVRALRTERRLKARVRGQTGHFLEVGVKLAERFAEWSELPAAITLQELSLLCQLAIPHIFLCTRVYGHPHTHSRTQKQRLKVHKLIWRTQLVSLTTTHSRR